MEKFNRTLRGYDPDEVNKFLDQVIVQVEKMVADIEEKDKLIKTLKPLAKENEQLKEKVASYERLEDTLNRAIVMAQKTSDQIKLAAHKESEAVLEDAKNSASRIINEALLRAEKVENETLTMRRNINTFKRRLKDIVQAQMDVIDEIDNIEI
jgi:cell division initiation protein